MKKILSVALSVVFALLIFASCSEGGSEGMLPDKIKLKKGDEFVYRFTRMLECQIDSKTHPYTSDLKKFMDVRFVVSDIDENGDYILTAFIQRISVDKKTSEGDSSSDTATDKQDPYFPLNDLTKAAPILFTLTQNGVLKDERFPDNFIDQIQTEFKDFDQIILSVMYQHIQSLAVEKYLSETNWYSRPPRPIGLNDKWQSEITREFTFGVSADLEITNTFKGKENGKFKVESSADISTKFERTSGLTNYSFYDMRGKYEGTFMLNPKNGLIHKSSTEARIEGEIEVPAVLLDEGTVPAKMCIRTTIELLK